MSEDEPKTVIVADGGARIDKELLARGGKFMRIPPPPAPRSLAKLWATLRVRWHAWKAHLSRHAPSRQRRVYITPVGDVVIYSWRKLTSLEAHSALLAAQSAERALLAGELGAWS